MANEVDITITARDMTGPAFASALVKMEMLKRAARDVSTQFSQIGTGGFDVNRASAYLTQLKSKIQSLGIADIADVNIPQGRLITQLAVLKRIIGQSGISDLVDFNVNPEQLTTQLGKIASMSETIPIKFDVGKLPVIHAPRVIEPTAIIPPAITGGNITENYSITGLAKAGAEIADVENKTLALSSSFRILENAKENLVADITGHLIPSIINSGNTINVFDTHVSHSSETLGEFRNVANIAGASAAAAGASAARGGLGFGFWGRGIGGTIGAVGLWHVALDLAVEGLIAVVGAAAAAAVGLAAMAPAATDIYQHLNNLHTISAALNQNIPPMTGNFQALSDSMKPNVIEAYGGGLYLLNRNTGAFGTTAHLVGGMLDNMIAKIDIWDRSQNGLGKLLQTGVGFLSQFGHIAGQVALAIGNLISKDPGITHFLLDFIGGAASLLNLVTKLPGPLIAGGLAFHAFYVYGNVAAGLLGRMVGSFGAADTAAGRLGARLSKGFSYADLVGPTGALIAIGAAIAYVALQSEEANTPTVKLANSIQNAFNIAAPAAALASAGADIAVYQKNISKAYSPQSLQEILQYQSSVKGLGSGVKDYFVGVGSNINKVMNDIASGHYKSEISDLGHAVTGFFSNQTNEAPAAAAAIRDYQAKINSVVTDSSNLRAVQLSLVASGNSWTGALDIMSQAGVKAGDSETLMIQKVNNLIGGYQNLSIGTGQAAAMFNAVNYATGQADNALGAYDKAMQPAVAAEAQLFGVLTGGESTMYSFISALQSMGTDSQVAGAKLDKFNVQSVKLGSDLYGSVLPAAESFINSIQMQGAGMNLLIPIVANTAGDILALTGQNKAAKLAVVDLINGALGPGTVSLQGLNTWVGKNSVSQQNFAKDVYTSMSNASQLAGVLNKNLIPMMNQAFIQATNLAPAMKTWFTDVINGTSGTAQGQRDRANLVRDIINAGTAAGDTKGQIEQMIAQILNIPLKKAIQIYMQASGSGSLSFSEKIFGHAPVTGGLAFAAAGGLVSGGTPGKDSVLVAAMPGELIVPTNLVKSGAADNLRGRIPGFSTGGIISGFNAGANWMNNVEAGFGRTGESDFAAAASADLRANVATVVKAREAAYAAQAALNYLPLGPQGPLSGSAAVAQAFARSIMFAYGWTQSQWPYELALWNQESGWNAYAANPTSNARGIPQNINGWSAYAPGDYKAQIRWGDAYISSRYGTPSNAWAHEKAFNWYDNGGWLRPGMNVMMNGTGGWEHLSRDSGDSTIALEVATGGASAFEHFMVMAIREWVVRKGGGNVQKAFGVRGR
jgi:hypothetical protein